MGICQFFNRLRQHQASPPVNEQFITIETTSTAVAWTPTSIVNSGATLEWEVTGGITIAPQIIDTPIFNLTGNAGTANITIKSTTNFVGLTEIWLNNGPASLEITSIDISEATALTKIDMFTNDLTSIDLSSNTALIYPWIQSNALTSIDLSSNILATFIAVDNNSLTALDISSNTVMTDLWANDNLLTTSELDAIINDADTNGQSNGEIRIAGNTGLPLTATSYQSYLDLVAKGWTIDVANSTPVDTEDPVIGTLAYANETDTTVELSMSVASTDNVAVVEHWIYKDYVFEKIISGATFSGHEITGLTASTNYDFTCVAYDAAGNFSLTSNTVNFTTDPTPTPPSTDDLRPVISNFRVDASYDTRVYFDSSEIVTASTGFNGYNGFMVTDKTINEITINSGSTINHYFTVTVAFDYYSNNTIRYEGGSDLTDSDSNGIYDFLITDIDNQIVEPTATDHTFYVDGSVSSSGNGLTEGAAFKTIGEGMTAINNEASPEGSTLWIKAYNYGNVNVIIGSSGTVTKPIKILGYKTTIGDSPSLTREIDLAFDSAEMPLLVGNGSGDGISGDAEEYIIIKNIQVENYTKCIEINHSSHLVLDNIYAKDAAQVIQLTLHPSNYIRITNSYVADATAVGIWFYGAYNLIQNTWSVSSRYVHMDYHITFNAGSLVNGYNIIKDSYTHSYYDDGHGDHAISIKGEPSNLSEYTLIENCIVENSGMGIEFRHENAKRNVTRNCYGTRTSDKQSAADPYAALVTFRDGCTHNIVENCTMEELSYGILFNDQPAEEGDQAGGHYNKVINSIFKDNDTDIRIAEGIDTGGALEPTYNEFLNCTFYHSDYLISHGSVPFGATNLIKNCILHTVSNYETSPTFSYSDFYNGFAAPSGTGNIDVNPEFTDEVNGDFSLTEQTPIEVYQGGSDVDVYYDFENRECFSPFSQGAYYKQSDDYIIFDGAIGFGSQWTFTDDYEVKIVTNLNDSGTGSLRDALESSTTYTGIIVVFNGLSGVITLSSNISILAGRQTYIAGQTSENGIGIIGSDYDGQLLRTNDNNVNGVIIRGLIMGRGNAPINDNDNGDCLAVGYDNVNVIVDRCTMLWGTDESIQIYNGGQNITFQNCIIGEALENVTTGHSLAFVIGSNTSNLPDRISIYNNAFISNKTRNPQIYQTDDKLEFVSNIIYNPLSIGVQIEDGGGAYSQKNFNLINNHCINGPGTNTFFDASIGINLLNIDIYSRGNITPYRSSSDPEWDAIKTNNTNDNAPTSQQSLTPFEYPLKNEPSITTQELIDAQYTDIGIFTRQANETRLLDDIANSTGAFVSSEGTITIASGSIITDTNNNGIPDSLEGTWGNDTFGYVNSIAI